MESAGLARWPAKPLPSVTEVDVSSVPANGHTCAGRTCSTPGCPQAERVFMSRHRVCRWIVVVAVVVVAGGCADPNAKPDQKEVAPQMIVRHEAGGDVLGSVEGSAPQDGYYELYRGPTPVARFELKKGDPLGFSSRPTAKYAS